MGLLRATAFAVALLVAVACAEGARHSQSKVKTLWSPVRVRAIVLAKTWVPQHDELQRLKDGRVLKVHVDDVFRVVLVVPHLGTLQLDTTPGAFVFIEPLQHVIVIGRVSNELHPRMEGRIVPAAPREKDENYRSAGRSKGG